jgi:hypothetical protein
VSVSMGGALAKNRTEKLPNTSRHRALLHLGAQVVQPHLTPSPKLQVFPSAHCSHSPPTRVQSHCAQPIGQLEEASGRTRVSGLRPGKELYPQDETCLFVIPRQFMHTSIFVMLQRFTIFSLKAITRRLDLSAILFSVGLIFLSTYSLVHNTGGVTLHILTCLYNCCASIFRFGLCAHVALDCDQHFAFPTSRSELSDIRTNCSRISGGSVYLCYISAADGDMQWSSSYECLLRWVASALLKARVLDILLCRHALYVVYVAPEQCPVLILVAISKYQNAI